MKRLIAPTNIASILFLLFAATLGISALFTSGLYTAHDIWHQVARLYHYEKSITIQSFPPSWNMLLANSYGYPLYIFSYHLPWVIGSALMKLGLAIIPTVKTLFGLSYVLSGILMYVFGRLTFKKEWSATCAAFLYLWAPHRFSTLFVSAAMGRSYVYLAIPIILIGYALINNNKKLGMVILATGIFCGILSHFISFTVILPLLFALFLLSKNKSLILISFLVGIGLSSFYLLPAIKYSRLTQVSTLSQLYEHNFITLKQVIYSRWGFGLPNQYASEGAISYQLGIVQWIVVILTTILIFFKKSNRFLTSLLTVFLFSIFMMTEESAFLWKILSKLLVIDYPATFLIPAVTTVSLITGYFLDKVKNQFILVLLLLPLSFYTNRNHIRVNEYVPYVGQEQIAAELTTNSYDEYLPKGADKTLLSEKEDLAIAQNLIISSEQLEETEIKFKLSTSQKQPIIFHQLGFPYVALFVNGKNMDYQIDERGRIKAEFEPGDYDIRIGVVRTKLSSLAMIISGVFFLITCRMLLRSLNDKKLSMYPKPS